MNIHRDLRPEKRPNFFMAPEGTGEGGRGRKNPRLTKKTEKWRVNKYNAGFLPPHGQLGTVMEIQTGKESHTYGLTIDRKVWEVKGGKAEAVEGKKANEIREFLIGHLEFLLDSRTLDETIKSRIHGVLERLKKH